METQKKLTENFMDLIGLRLFITGELSSEVFSPCDQNTGTNTELFFGFFLRSNKIARSVQMG